MAWDSAGRIIELRLARGLELRESWRIPAVQRPVGRVTNDREQAILGEETLSQDHVKRDVNAFFSELSLDSQQDPAQKLMVTLHHLRVLLRRLGLVLAAVAVEPLSRLLRH